MIDSKATQRPPITTRDAQEIEHTTYGVECPGCGEWYEHDRSHVGKKAFECVCGTWIRSVS